MHQHDTQDPRQAEAARIEPADQGARIARDRFRPLPVPLKQDGTPRRTGVEIEFAGLTEDETAEVVRALWGGRGCRTTAHEQVVQGTRLGDVKVELDIFLRDKAGSALADALLDLARTVVPVEVVTEPLAPAELPQVDRLVVALRDAGALGSRDGIFFGFGVHLNPEIAAPAAHAVVPVVRAYALLEDWLRATDPVDPSRRVLPFVDPWPMSFVTQAAARGGDWSLDDLARVYLDHTPTRNRGLDLLPLLEHLCPALMASALSAADRKPGRPTWHFRLPEARLDDPAWTIAYEWNRWVLVERVAADAALLETMAADHAAQRPALLATRSGWAAQVGARLEEADIWT